ncbi:MAG TPA: DUF72 domain-containing protein [Thermoanaerobaculia bacterium]|nr:DUF72 domain-containing protein [Thermoanaerobaculia bacterium]
MRIVTGTSGYSYKEWKGSFYPDDLPAAKMLAYYAERFDTVEINNTFYRMPDPKTVERWGAEVPERFTFILKAPQRITHQKKLGDVADDLHYFFDTAAVLGPKLGPVLFQMPPFARKDADKLRDFIRRLPPQRRAAFEFRHPSWFDDEIFAILRDHDAALCAADTDEVEDPETVLTPTASWGYVRLRRSEYAGDAIAAWADRVKRQPWSEAFVFFKHEDEGKGPQFAGAFRAAC